MKPTGYATTLIYFLLATLLFSTSLLRAQECLTTADMDASTRTSLQDTVRGYNQAAQGGDQATLQQNADFDLGDLISDNQSLLSSAGTLRSIYLLENSPGPSSNTSSSPRHVEYFCGIYNSSQSVGFVFEGLPAGRYSVAITDFAAKTPAVLTWILRQSGSQWRIAGAYIRPAQQGGHDGQWYLTQARAYKTKGQLHNAWLYYRFADDLLRPLPAMSTPQLDRLYDEMQAVKPADVPAGAPVELAAAGRTFQISQIFATPVGDSLDVVVKYLQPDISDTNRTFQSNLDVIKAVVAKYPELREAFAGVVARAVAPNGQDYGSMLAMKDVK